MLIIDIDPQIGHTQSNGLSLLSSFSQLRYVLVVLRRILTPDTQIIGLLLLFGLPLNYI